MTFYWSKGRSEGGRITLMGRTLYFLKDAGLNAATGTDSVYFGTQPNGKATANEYANLKRKISLKNDLKWREVEHLQRTFAAGGVWKNFPAYGLKFITAEVKAGDEDQRIDLLYLRDDGGLYPCELKIGGDSLDTHGQLLRYISDLHYQKIDRKWIIDKRIQYLSRKGKTDERDHLIEKAEWEEYFIDNHIEDRHIRLIQNSGIIVDENYTPQLLKAVRYMNERCGFSIRMLRLDAFVADEWALSSQSYLMRIDIVEIQ